MIKLERIGWRDKPDETTPLSSGNLKKMEDNTENAVNETVKITQGKLNYNTKFSDVAINEWYRVGQVVFVEFIGKTTEALPNVSNIIELPFMHCSNITPHVSIGDRYYAPTYIFAFTSAGSKWLSSSPIEAGKYVHIYFSYLTNE